MKIRVKRNYKRIALFALVVLSVTAGVLISFRLAFFMLPFLLAFALSSVMEPLVKFTTNKLHISRNIIAPLALLLLLGVIILLAVLVVLRLIEEAKALISQAPGFFTTLYTQISGLVSSNSEFIDWLPAEITDNLGSLFSNLSNSISNLSRSVLKGLFNTAISMPEAMMFTIITILATLFMLKDREKIASEIRHQLPKIWYARLMTIKDDLFSAIFGYLRAALIIMVITFTELLIGLSIIGIEYALLFALLIALIDLFPILGSGTILIPWFLYSFAIGDMRMGISILILYAVITIIRQAIEPKIVGEQIGVYPLITLLAMYAGLRIVGFIGIFLGPITFLLIRNILTMIYKGKSIREIISPDIPDSSDDFDGSDGLDEPDVPVGPDSDITTDAGEASVTDGTVSDNAQDKSAGK
ncbi:MAG: sporulation integral membrane protein YtvI [Clostridiaceae bacterium]|jgi:sporulation integral membrane protein YtvI|nr:sporulation integral membrane protein YtvI [Clostridiaceae bacterium]